MAENLVGKLISQNRPTDQQIFTYPYILAKQQGKEELENFITINNYDSTFENTRNNLIQAMKHLTSLERKKEQEFINSYLRLVMENDPEFALQLQTILESGSAGRLSQALEVIQLYRSKQWNALNTIEKNFSDFETKWGQVSNINFTKAVQEVGKKILNDKNLSLKIPDLISMIEEEVLLGYSEGVREENAEFVKRVFRQVSSLARTKFGQEFEATFEELEKGEYVQKKLSKHKKKTSSKYANDSVETIMRDYVLGLVNGLSAEIFLEYGGLGKGTGRIGMAEKRLSKSGGTKEGRAIQTDNIEIVSFVLNSPDIDYSELEQETTKTLSQMRAWLDRIDLKDKMIVHTSVKDYGASSKDIHLRGTKPLDVRLSPLVEICEQVNMNKGDIQNLIFALANAGEYMVANDLHKSGILAQALSAVSVAYMFEDYIDTFQQLDTDTSNKELHVFFINGHYYTMSDILNRSMQQLEERIGNGLRGARNNVVRVTFIPTKENVFKDKSLNALSGIDRWDQVRNLTLDKSRLGVSVKVEQLKNIILSLDE